MEKNPKYLPQFQFKIMTVELTAKGLETKIFNLEQTDTVTPLPSHDKK